MVLADIAVRSRSRWIHFLRAVAGLEFGLSRIWRPPASRLKGLTLGGNEPGYPASGRHLESVEQGRLEFRSFSSGCVEDGF